VRNSATNKRFSDDSPLIAVIDSTNNTLRIVPISPHRVAVNPVTNRIYVTNNHNTVTIIDGATYSVIGNLVVGSDNISFKQALVINQVTNKIYVTTGSDDTITVIDGATNTTKTVTALKHPVAAAVNLATNRVYITNNDNTVTIIDGATDSIISTLAVGSDDASFKQALVVNQVTNKIYVVNGNNNTVTIIDGATYTTSTLTTGITPRAIALNEKTNKIYVANYGSNNVTVSDGATNVTTTMTVRTHPNALAVNPETNKVYVTSEDDDAITVIDSSIVVEFYNTHLDNYFLTANADEANAIDGGSAGPGWVRTGNVFNLEVVPPSAASMEVNRLARIHIFILCSVQNATTSNSCKQLHQLRISDGILRI
jgi:YVTN family beta-propeller protein